VSISPAARRGTRAGGKYLIERSRSCPVEVDYGSEYRPQPDRRAERARQSSSRSRVRRPTRGAAPRGQAQGAQLAICNVVGSMATRDREGTSTRRRARKSASASHQAFTSHWSPCSSSRSYMAQVRGPWPGEIAPHRGAAAAAPHHRADDQASAAMEKVRSGLQPHDFLYLGRGINYPIALRGREAQGNLVHPRRRYQAGSMKPRAMRS